MHKSGRNATLRNRNIGTRKSGHGKDNRLTIPEQWADGHVFHERLINPVRLDRVIHGSEITFLVEPVQPGFFHSCTPQDIQELLVLFPPEHISPIRMIVLRQPKRKQRILSSVWGRLQYEAEIAGISGPAIHVDAQQVNEDLRWSKSMSPDRLAELKRLEADGHVIRSDKRHFYIKTCLNSVRNTQLFRTIPHEVGHYVDFMQVTANSDFEDDGDNWDVHRQKPQQEKEVFAHRYATCFSERQTGLGTIPFPRRYDPSTLLSEGLDPQWFLDVVGREDREFHCR